MSFCTLEAGTGGTLMVRTCLFSPHRTHSASRFSLIASLLQALNLSQGYYWNNKASAPRDCIHLFHEETFLCSYYSPRVCITTRKQSNGNKKKRKRCFLLMYATQINKDYKQMCAIVCILGAWICICWAFKQRHNGRPNLLSAQPLFFFPLLWKACSLNNHTWLWQ